MIRYLLAALLLLAWGGMKIPWEESMDKERNKSLFGTNLPVSFELRDSLGQGMTVAALGGFRGLAANFLWLSLTTAWEDQEWTRVRTLAELAVYLQPRVMFFWENGSWHMAWNASVAAENYSGEANADRRQRESLKWIEAGRDMLERGIRVNPTTPSLYQRLAELYWQRLQDYSESARYYEKAAALPGTPTYVERFVGYALEKAGKFQEAYDYWKKLWLSSEEHPANDQRRWPKVEQEIRKLEKQLNIPADKRLFPS